MYQPDKYDMRQIGVPYHYVEKEQSKTGKRMFHQVETSFQTMKPKKLEVLPDRWVSEFQDHYTVYTNEPLPSNQPFRHNYDMFDPHRSLFFRKFEAKEMSRVLPPLEQVVPSRYNPVAERVSREPTRIRKEVNKSRKKSSVDDADVEERVRMKKLKISRDSKNIEEDGEFPPDRKKVFTQAEDTKFHSGKTHDERQDEQKEKALKRLERAAFDGVRNVKPTFVLPKGTKPDFCNFGWGNQDPVKEENYMKTFNVKARRVSQLHDYVTTRRDKTHGYDEWRKYMHSTPQNFLPTDAWKRKKLTRPKTPPRMHAAKKKGYQGVSHYFGENGSEGEPKKIQKKSEKQKKRKIVKPKIVRTEKNERVEVRKSQERNTPTVSLKRKEVEQTHSQYNKRGFRHYVKEEPLEEIIEHGENVEDEDFSEDEDDLRNMTKIMGGEIHKFQPKKFNNEVWDPRKFKKLPSSFTCFIRSAGKRGVKGPNDSVGNLLNQFG